METAVTSHNDGSRRVLISGGSGFIGSQLIRSFEADPAWTTLNLDLAAPEDEALGHLWVEGDVLDAPGLATTFERFRPTAVVHLAARVDVSGTQPSDYRVNTEGTANVIECADRFGTDRIVVSSTQFVCRPGHLPRSDDDYSPHTAYGESKVAAERLTRAASLSGSWTIVRPTTIWGPGDLRYRSHFYRVMARGLYVHPSGPPAMRSYGYVGNVVHQIRVILDVGADLVHARTLYLGDPVAPLTDFVEEFARQAGTRIRKVPRVLVRSIAAVGDALGAAGLSFPITTSRYLSMTEDYPVPIDATFELLGPPRYSLEDGVRETVTWLREIGYLPSSAD